LLRQRTDASLGCFNTFGLGDEFQFEVRTDPFDVVQRAFDFPAFPGDFGFPAAVPHLGDGPKTEGFEQGLPTTIFYDKDLNVVDKIVGATDVAGFEAGLQKAQ